MYIYAMSQKIHATNILTDIYGHMQRRKVYQ